MSGKSRWIIDRKRTIWQVAAQSSANESLSALSTSRSIKQSNSWMQSNWFAQDSHCDGRAAAKQTAGNLTVLQLRLVGQPHFLLKQINLGEKGRGPKMAALDTKRLRWRTLGWEFLEKPERSLSSRITWVFVYASRWILRHRVALEQLYNPSFEFSLIGPSVWPQNRVKVVRTARAIFWISLFGAQ